MLNTYLRALNRLRALAPMDALDGVLDALASGLARSEEMFVTYVRTWGDEGTEREIVRAAGTAYVRVLVPFLRRAVVEGVFGVAYAGSNSGRVEGDDAGLLRDWLVETAS